ncbi:hypothetical protein SAMD00019534_018600 [Acytostelium subglobosum LB1]|uniref:hypothetical protein n=1 Tax=Acytostelium subglobosum LB1 TaxID=1410327 RepID=UPI000644EF0B|nr:hypothetical protein SAMD00019534_018600 [Acytostelium subglobosum LB1]GAM18685.1 hypothetical protein SAMD00019534_018600 [Acytostelium subglobosum LB1]|eukprot:XP_012757905.1 hypothetical protein SAMD00019534_018600 [Acytostelium subglobosum LB1]
MDADLSVGHYCVLNKDKLDFVIELRDPMPFTFRTRRSFPKSSSSKKKKEGKMRDPQLPYHW